MDETPRGFTGWQMALVAALERMTERQPIFLSPRRGGKTEAMRQILGHKPSFLIIDEWTKPIEIEPLPPIEHPWKEQKPPVQPEQKKRAPGVVLMRDRTGKLVERKLK